MEDITRNDFPVWSLTLNGQFSTTSLRNLLQPMESSFDYFWIWKLKMLNKVKCFLWQGSHDRLHTNSYLRKLNIINSDICQMCHSSSESLAHILLRCSIAKRFWDSYNVTFPIDDQIDAHCIKIIKEKKIISCLTPTSPRTYSSLLPSDISGLIEITPLIFCYSYQ